MVIRDTNAVPTTLVLDTRTPEIPGPMETVTSTSAMATIVDITGIFTMKPNPTLEYAPTPDPKKSAAQKLRGLAAVAAVGSAVMALAVHGVLG